MDVKFLSVPQSYTEKDISTSCSVLFTKKSTFSPTLATNVMSPKDTVQIHLHNAGNYEVKWNPDT